MNVHTLPLSARQSRAVVAMIGIPGLQELARQASAEIRTYPLPKAEEMSNAAALEQRLREEFEYVEFHRHALFWENVAKLLGVHATSDNVEDLALKLNNYRLYFQDVVLQRKEDQLPSARGLCQAISMANEH